MVIRFLAIFQILLDRSDQSNDEEDRQQSLSIDITSSKITEFYHQNMEILTIFQLYSLYSLISSILAIISQHFHGYKLQNHYQKLGISKIKYRINGHEKNTNTANHNQRFC